MKRLRVFVWSILFSLCSLSVWAKDAVYEFQVPDFDQHRSERPLSKSIGDLVFQNNVRIAAYDLTVPNPVNTGMITTEPASMVIDETFDRLLAKKLDAYAQPNGWILVPKGWKAYAAGVGANGSVALLFAPDETGKYYLTYFDTSSCVGCAYSSASLFFDDAKQLAEENEFSYYSRANVAVKKIKLRPTHVAFSYRLSYGVPIHGLAIFDVENEGNLYRQISVRAPVSEKSVTSTILNWYVPKK